MSLFKNRDKYIGYSKQHYFGNAHEKLMYDIL